MNIIMFMKKKMLLNILLNFSSAFNNKDFPVNDEHALKVCQMK